MCTAATYKTKDFYFYFFFDFLTLKFALFYNSQNRICLAKFESISID